MKFWKHIPAFAYDGQRNPPIEFSSLDDLLSSLKTGGGGESFSHWARSGKMIMGVWDDGLKWWVMGYSDGDLSSLPEWKAEYLAMVDGSPKRLKSEDVVSSCAGRLTLKDGSQVVDATRI